MNFEENNYNPTPRVAEILNWCLEKIKEVPYETPLRWVFYRAVQEKGLGKKTYNNFKKWTSNARKRFWNGWRPDTLIDDTREIMHNGGGYETPEKWFESFKKYECVLNKRQTQPYIVLVWFEAAAMVRQFQYYTAEYYVPLVPFRGDISIPQKWELAKWIEELSEIYDKPIKALYFGDLDPKGLEIPQNALRDIEAWCSVDFEFEWIGLKPEHVERWNIPDNPERPNQYQWEALDDDAAKELIQDALEKVVDLEAIAEVEELEDETTEKWRNIIEKSLEEVKDT